MSIIQAITKFCEYFDELDAKYDLRIVSDNPVFDIAFIDYYFDKYLDRAPLTYRKDITVASDDAKDSNYRLIIDSSSYYRGFVQDSIVNKWGPSDSDIANAYNIKSSPITGHLPEDDACHMLEIFMFMSSPTIKKLDF